jgi:thiamine biosynthesis lipoprotein ApbE
MRNTSTKKHAIAIELRQGRAEIEIVVAQDSRNWELVLEKCGQLMRDVQKFLHSGVADSDLQRLSMCGHLAPMSVHPWTYDALRRCVSHCEAAQGSLDITYLPRESPRQYRNHQHALQEWHEAGAWSDVAFLRGHRVQLLRPLRVELLDLVDAYCVDKAFEHLQVQRNLLAAAVRYGNFQRELGSSAHELASEAQPSLRPAQCVRPGYFLRSLSGLIPVKSWQHPLTGKKTGAQKSIAVYSPTCMTAGLLSRSLLRAPQELWRQLLASTDSLALFVSKKDEMTLFPMPR